VTERNAKIRLTIDKAEVHLREFEWYYKKELIFPKIRDNGKADAAVRNLGIKTVLSIDPSFNSLKIKKMEIKIGNLEIKTKDTKASVVYNLILTAFKQAIKAALKKLITPLLTEILDNTTLDILQRADEKRDEAEEKKETKEKEQQEHKEHHHHKHGSHHKKSSSGSSHKGKDSIPASPSAPPKMQSSPLAQTHSGIPASAVSKDPSSGDEEGKKHPLATSIPPPVPAVAKPNRGSPASRSPVVEKRDVKQAEKTEGEEKDEQADTEDLSVEDKLRRLRERKAELLSHSEGDWKI